MSLNYVKIALYIIVVAVLAYLYFYIGSLRSEIELQKSNNSTLISNNNISKANNLVLSQEISDVKDQNTLITSYYKGIILEEKKKNSFLLKSKESLNKEVNKVRQINTDSGSFSSFFEDVKLSVEE